MWLRNETVFTSVHVQLQKTKNGSTAALMLILELLFVQMFHQVFREHSKEEADSQGFQFFTEVFGHFYALFHNAK